MPAVGQTQVALWPYLLTGVLTVALVALLLILGVYLARKLQNPRILDYIRLALGLLTIVALGYSFVRGPLALLGMVAAPAFIGAMLVSGLYRDWNRSRESAPRDTGESSDPGEVPRPDDWFLVLWAFASAVGGTLGGFGLILSFFGQLILFGLLVGVAQTLVLLLHRVSGAWLWIPASFFGWILGSSISAFDSLFLPEDATNTVSSPFIFGWGGLAVAQGLTLIYLVLSNGPDPENRRRSVLPVLAWFPAGILGGVLAGISSGALAAWMFSEGGLFGESGRGLLYQMAPGIIAGAGAGLVYGLLTGTVLLWVLRSLGIAHNREPEVETGTL